MRTPLVQGKQQREHQAVRVCTVGVRHGTHVRQHTNDPLVSPLAPALEQEGEQRHEQKHAGNAADHNAGNGSTAQAAVACVKPPLNVSSSASLLRQPAVKARVIPSASNHDQKMLSISCCTGLESWRL